MNGFLQMLSSTSSQISFLGNPEVTKTLFIDLYSHYTFSIEIKDLRVDNYSLR